MENDCAYIRMLSVPEKKRMLFLAIHRRHENISTAMILDMLRKEVEEHDDFRTTDQTILSYRMKRYISGKIDDAHQRYTECAREYESVVDKALEVIAEIHVCEDCTAKKGLDDRLKDLKSTGAQLEEQLLQEYSKVKVYSRIVESVTWLTAIACTRESSVA